MSHEEREQALNKPFDEIAKQLDEIAAAHFDGIEKTI